MDATDVPWTEPVASTSRVSQPALRVSPTETPFTLTSRRVALLRPCSRCRANQHRQILRLRSAVREATVHTLAEPCGRTHI